MNAVVSCRYWLSPSCARRRLICAPSLTFGAETARLRAAGLTDRQVVDVVLAGALRNYYSRALLALAVPPDVPPDLPDELRQALLDGVPGAGDPGGRASAR